MKREQNGNYGPSSFFSIHFISTPKTEITYFLLLRNTELTLAFESYKGLDQRQMSSEWTFYPIQSSPDVLQRT